MQLIPINEKKIPLVKNWQTSKDKHDLSNCYGRGLVCGSISNNIEAIDIDLKYDLTGKLFDQYKNAIHRSKNDLLQKLVVQKTMSGGYHFIYRCSKIEGNKKLANRYANESEKATGEKVKVLIETRGEGGYIAIYPTPKYEIVHGQLDNILEITPEERDILFSCAQEFNEVFIEHKPTQQPKTKSQTGLSPFEDYDENGDVLQLLLNHGWTQQGKRGAKVLLRRPGTSTAASSGNFDFDLNRFSVFSTSTEFQPQTSYKRYAVFAMLECRGDYKEASAKLYEMGFGERRENKSNLPVAESKPRIDINDGKLNFVATGKDYDVYLDQWRKGTFQKGLSTGIPALDKHFLFKPSSLVIVNGIDNVGKSTVIWYLAMLSSILHGWKWIIFTSENSTGSFMRKMIEFYWSEPINNISEEKFQEAKLFVEAHFKIILSDDDLYTFQDILDMTTKLLKTGSYQSLLIDPYNSLYEDPKVNSHSFHYMAISKIKLFTKMNNICVYINCHVVTLSTRTQNGEKQVKAPKKADTEGGGKFANKADDFLTIHRNVADPETWMLTEIHVRKIKETETGGKVTPMDFPVIIQSTNYLTGFMDEQQINPIIKNQQQTGKGFKPFEAAVDHKKLAANDNFLNERGNNFVT